MSNAIYVDPSITASVISIGDACYQYVGPSTTQPATVFAVDGEFDDCSDCPAAPCPGSATTTNPASVTVNLTAGQVTITQGGFSTTYYWPAQSVVIYSGGGSNWRYSNTFGATGPGWMVGTTPGGPYGENTLQIFWVDSVTSPPSPDGTCGWLVYGGAGGGEKPQWYTPYGNNPISGQTYHTVTTGDFSGGTGSATVAP